ncbi:hypothetical protein HXX76_003807 [Chlamydomonas incerta]|uniref:Pseudouridine synthase RsuA/RluA-like domain-containing protein n=1 Tax=Chlamydomonas incerta TaxID=51695 RepID=A0A835W873_CHLIN|nr:hypothetical protein HXX76_003807 [Chlamydomonas incerta]|eukprot:KAG2440954.1 hypothetical protein HXX76_003807 [Chlamydomonas incerta]
MLAFHLKIHPVNNCRVGHVVVPLRSLSRANVKPQLAGALARPQPRAAPFCQRRGALLVVAAGKKGGADEDDDEDDGETVSSGKPMRVERLLANLGYGKRRECQQMVKKGHVVRKDGGKLKVGDKVAWSDLELEGGEGLDPAGPLLLALHKPTGYVVTAPDDENISDSVVYDLLPYRFGRRRPFLSCVGRLDKDTSGLLLLTDDGTLLHRINSPKRGIWKVYEATLADPLSAKAAEAAAKKFASGTLTLEGDFAPLLPAKLERTGERTARVAICEGRYHQVRRMFAAVGHKVVGLRRVSVGGLALAGLPEGEWRFLSPQDLESVFAGPSSDDIFASGDGGGGSGVVAMAAAAERDGSAAASTSGRGAAGPEEQEEQEAEAEAGERLTKKEKKKGRKEDVRAAKRAARSGPAAAGEDGEGEGEEEDLDEVADVELLEFDEAEEDELEAAAAARRAAAGGGRRPRKPRRATVRQGVVIDGKGQGVEEEGLGLDAAAYEGESADVLLSSGAGGGVRKYKDDTRWRRRRDALKELLPNKQ